MSFNLCDVGMIATTSMLVEANIGCCTVITLTSNWGHLFWTTSGVPKGPNQTTWESPGVGLKPKIVVYNKE